jgi:hypothetical protein
VGASVGVINPDNTRNRASNPDYLSAMNTMEWLSLAGLSGLDFVCSRMRPYARTYVRTRESVAVNPILTPLTPLTPTKDPCASPDTLLATHVYSQQERFV